MHKFQPSNLTHDRNGNPFVGVRVAAPERARHNPVYIADYRMGWHLAAQGLPQEHCQSDAMRQGYRASKIAPLWCAWVAGVRG